MTGRSWLRGPVPVVAATAGLVLGLLAALFLSDLPPAPPPARAAAIIPPTDPLGDTPPTRPAAAKPIARPTRVVIPAIGVRAKVVPVGLNADGSMEVPEFGLTGWYTRGPRPGAPGPAVVVAHVDSYKGPDVFYRLGQLRPGQRVLIRRADGTSAAWRVRSSEQTPKDELPAHRIWNDTTRPVLRLVTCGGTFDRATGHYDDNIIVYADPA